MMTNVHIFTFLLLIVALFATSFAFPTANTDDPLIAFEAQTTKEHSKNDTETGILSWVLVFTELLHRI